MSGVSVPISRLVPMLASDHDGEVLATVRAIGRKLKAVGLDFHWMADRLAEPDKIIRVGVETLGRRLREERLARFCQGICFRAAAEKGCRRLPTRLGQIDGLRNQPGFGLQEGDHGGHQAYGNADCGSSNENDPEKG